MLTAINTLTMRHFVTFFLFLIITVGNAQIKKSKYDLDKKCYSLEQQQQPLNACLAETVTKLEKIVEIKYNCILNYLQSEIEDCSTSKCEDLEYYIKNKNDFINSQKAWVNLKDKNAAFWSGGGGTITNQYIAESIIKDCKDRLVWLDNIIEEEGQGNETRILKCE
jgi:uncharacterized protein YecT (DUF1311 family)